MMVMMVMKVMKVMKVVMLVLSSRRTWQAGSLVASPCKIRPHTVRWIDTLSLSRFHFHIFTPHLARYDLTRWVLFLIDTLSHFPFHTSPCKIWPHTVVFLLNWHTFTLSHVTLQDPTSHGGFFVDLTHFHFHTFPFTPHLARSDRTWWVFRLISCNSWSCGFLAFLPHSSYNVSFSVKSYWWK